MKRLVLAALLALSLIAQTGTITVATNITATAGTLVCVITPDASGNDVSFTCRNNGTLVLTASVTPAASGASGITLGATIGTNSVTALLTKPAAAITWDVAANGTRKTGTF